MNRARRTPAIGSAAGANQLAMKTEGSLQILLVESIVRENLAQVVLEGAHQVGRHPRRGDTICFDTGQFAVRKAGIKMQAQKKIAIRPIGNRNPFDHLDFHIIGARQHDFPALAQQQLPQTQRPVQRVIFFELAVEDAAGATVDAAVAGIKHHGTAELGGWSPGAAAGGNSFGRRAGEYAERHR